MNKILLFVLTCCAVNSSSAQKTKGNLDFSKNAPIDKSKSIAVLKDRKDKYYYNQQIEKALMKAGYSVAEDNPGGSTPNQQAYHIEYHIGPVAKKGKDDFGFEMHLFENASGKMIAMGDYVVSDKSKIISNIDKLIKEFIDKLSE